jgi:hypothetical protein
MTFRDLQASRTSCGASLARWMPPNAVDCQILTRNTTKSAVIACSGSYLGGLSC